MSAASSEKQSAKSSLWSKVLLWLVVLLIGFLYIRSVAHREPPTASVVQDKAVAAERQPEAEQTTGTLPSIKSTRDPAAGQETAAVAGGELVGETEAGPVEMAPAAVAITSEPASVESTGAAEEGAPPRTAVAQRQETVAAKPAPVPAQEPAVAGTPGGDATPEAAPAAVGEAEEEPPAVEQEVSPEEAKAFAEAVVSQEAPEPAPEAPEDRLEDATSEVPEGRLEDAAREVPEGRSEDAAPAAPPNQPQDPRPAQVPTPVPRDERRARIMAEYEAMRKAAEAEWKRRGLQMPQGPYGGMYPGYGYPPPYPYQRPSRQPRYE